MNHFRTSRGRNSKYPRIMPKLLLICAQLNNCQMYQRGLAARYRRMLEWYLRRQRRERLRVSGMRVRGIRSRNVSWHLRGKSVRRRLLFRDPAQATAMGIRTVSKSFYTGQSIENPRESSEGSILFSSETDLPGG
jgi:hypothetical protein